MCSVYNRNYNLVPNLSLDEYQLGQTLTDLQQWNYSAAAKEPIVQAGKIALNASPFFLSDMMDFATEAVNGAYNTDENITIQHHKDL